MYFWYFDKSKNTQDFFLKTSCLKIKDDSMVNCLTTQPPWGKHKKKIHQCLAKTQSVENNDSKYARFLYDLNPVRDFKRSLKHQKKNNQQIGLDLDMKTGSYTTQYVSLLFFFITFLWNAINILLI